MRNRDGLEEGIHNGGRNMVTCTYISQCILEVESKAYVNGLSGVGEGSESKRGIKGNSKIFGF